MKFTILSGNSMSDSESASQGKGDVASYTVSGAGSQTMSQTTTQSPRCSTNSLVIARGSKLKPTQSRQSDIRLERRCPKYGKDFQKSLLWTGLRRSKSRKSALEKRSAGKMLRHSSRGFAMVEASLAVFLVVTMVFGTLNLMRYYSARSALEQAAIAASRCISPTDGECQILKPVPAEPRFDWYGYRESQEVTGLVNRVHYEGSVVRNNWEASVKGYRLDETRINVRFPVQDVYTEDFELALNRYRRDTYSHTPYTLEWTPANMLPTFDDAKEIYCVYADPTGGSSAYIGRSGEECAAQHTGVDFKHVYADLSSTSPIGRNGSGRGAAEEHLWLVSPAALGVFETAKVHVPELWVRGLVVDGVRVADRKVSDNAQCLDDRNEAHAALTSATTPAKCRDNWQHSARVALLVTTEVRCLTCSPNQVVTVGYDQVDGRSHPNSLALVIYDRNGNRVEEVSLGGIEKTSVSSQFRQYNYHLRGPDKSHGSYLGCKGEACRTRYDKLYVPRGGYFRVLTRLHNLSRQHSIQARVSVRYVYDDYAVKADVLPTLKVYNDKNRARAECLASISGRDGDCIAGTVDSETRCAKPAGESGFVAESGVEKLVEHAVPMCGGKRGDYLARHVSLPAGRMACGSWRAVSRVDTKRLYRVSRLSGDLSLCDLSSGSMKPKTIESNCLVKGTLGNTLGDTDYQSVLTSRQWKESCDGRLAAEISKVRKESGDFPTHRLFNLKAQFDAPRIDSTTQSKFQWDKGNYTDYGFQEVALIGQYAELARTQETRSKYVPPAKNFSWRVDSSVGQLTEEQKSALADVPSDVSYAAQLASSEVIPIKSVYPFDTEEAVEIPSWVGSGDVGGDAGNRQLDGAQSDSSKVDGNGQICQNNYAGMKVTSENDALRYFASHALPELRAVDSSGNYLVAFNSHSFGGRKSEVSVSEIGNIASRFPCTPIEWNRKMVLNTIPSLIGQRGADRPTECGSSGQYRNCYAEPVTSEMDTQWEYDRDYKTAISKAKSVLNNFLGATYDCGEGSGANSSGANSSGCASIAVKELADGKVKVSLTYNMPLTFPLDLILGKSYLELRESKAEYTELSSVIAFKMRLDR